MKLLIIQSILLAAMHGFASANNECIEKARKITVNMTECCKFPDFFDEKVHDEVSKKLVADGTAPSTPLFNCLLEQSLFQSLHLADKSGKIDKEACKKYIKENVKNKNWEPIVQKAFEVCEVESVRYGENYQKMTKISIETCDFKYDAISDCMDIASFGKCPADSWTTVEDKKEPCEFLKGFIKDCYKDIPAIDEFLDHQQD